MMNATISPINAMATTTATAAPTLAPALIEDFFSSEGMEDEVDADALDVVRLVDLVARELLADETAVVDTCSVVLELVCAIAAREALDVVAGSADEVDGAEEALSVSNMLYYHGIVLTGSATLL